MTSRHRLLWLLLVFLSTCLGLVSWWCWRSVQQPPRLTRLHGQEFYSVLAAFEAAEYSLDIQLHPEKLRSVATKAYLGSYLSVPPLNCSGCGQFWVTTSAEVSQICVLRYSRNESLVRATARRIGHQVDGITFDPVGPLAGIEYRSTYHLVMEGGVWKINRITSYTPATKGQADLFEVLQEQWKEVGCP